MRETHASWVFLTGKFVYKVKKPVKFGDILNFETLKRRKAFCNNEVKLNARCSPDLYLGVVTITKRGKIAPSDDPLEYAVKMKQMSEEHLMENLLNQKLVTIDDVTKLGEELALFHKAAEKVPDRGKMEFIKEKWDENFRTTKTFRGINLKFKSKIENFMVENENLFVIRIKNERIGDNHGDLIARNIFILPEQKIKIFDCIDFNPLLRYGDTLEDVGFMAMDLDFHNEEILSNEFVKRYKEVSEDTELDKLLNFYKCYRAYVRGKVFGFEASNEKKLDKKNKLQELSEKYYRLAYKYGKNL